MLKDLQLKSLWFIICLTLAGQLSAPEVLAMINDASDSPILPSGKSSTAIVDELIGSVNSFGSYKYDGTQEAQNGEKFLKASGTFYFKPVKSMRVEVKQFGSKSGSVLVRREDGKIKAKGGPQMLGIKMSLGPDSRLLQMPNGLSAFNCDLSSLFDRLKKEAASGCKILSAERPMRLENFGKPVILIESQMASDSGVKVIDRVFVDPFLKVPLQWDQFENGKFQSRSLFENYQTNINLDDSMFII